MIRRLTNKTATAANVQYGTRTLIVAPGATEDLAAYFQLWELAACDELITLLAQGTDKYQLNDGTYDLSMPDAIDSIRGYTQKLKLNDDSEVITSLSGMSSLSDINNQSMLRVCTEKPDTSRQTTVTHDWTDPTTWYETSIRVVDEPLTNSGNNVKYNFAHTFLIDNYHGKIMKEDYVKDKDGYSLRVAVKVNGVSKTEQDPHYGTGGDFVVNYPDGYIEFLSALQESDVVTATYHYMQNSIFTLKAPAGKALSLLMAEAQFSMDSAMNDSIVFQPRGKVEFFAPQLVDNPYPAGTMIPLENPTIYKAYSDFVNDAIKMYPVSQPIGGNNWRSTPVALSCFNWDYVCALKIHSSTGMEIQIRLQHDAPMSGWYVTLSFYCSVEPE